MTISFMRDQFQTLPVGRFLLLTKKIEEDYLTKSCLSFLKQTYSTSSIVRTWLQNPIHYVFREKLLHRAKSYSRKIYGSVIGIDNYYEVKHNLLALPPQVQLQNRRLLEMRQPFSTAEETQLDSKLRRIMRWTRPATRRPESFRCCFRRWEWLRLLSVSTESSKVNNMKKQAHLDRIKKTGSNSRDVMREKKLQRFVIWSPSRLLISICKVCRLTVPLDRLHRNPHHNPCLFLDSEWFPIFFFAITANIDTALIFIFHHRQPKVLFL